MSSKSSIEWTDATWNPTSGCTKVSPGCANCYIERTPPFRIGHRQFDEKGTTGVLLHPERVDQPLRWKKHRRIFVNSLSDLFHEEVKDHTLFSILAVMCAAKQHTFQVLTKRPARMREFLGTPLIAEKMAKLGAWPPPHIQWGVSVENQHFADERIPLLLQTPAAVRFISAEPLLSEVKLKWEWVSRGKPMGGGPQINMREPWKEHVSEPALDWVIVGGESGPGARPFNIQWGRNIIAQCQFANVPVFCKQLGAFVISDNQQDWLGHKGRVEATGNGLEERYRILFNDKKGGDISEWPEDLRVREFPQ